MPRRYATSSSYPHRRSTLHDHWWRGADSGICDHTPAAGVANHDAEQHFSDVTRRELRPDDSGSRRRTRRASTYLPACRSTPPAANGFHPPRCTGSSRSARRVPQRVAARPPSRQTACVAGRRRPECRAPRPRRSICCRDAGYECRRRRQGWCARGRPRR